MSKAVQLRSSMGVELVDSMGDDSSIIRAARVSSGTEASAESRYAIGATVSKDGTQSNLGLLPPDRGLMNMLMRDRHGSPFEAVDFQFRIECPIFVAREVFRHRIASYNETSSRYRELEPVFYCPDNARPLIQEGKPGAYTFTSGDRAQQFRSAEAHHRIACYSWEMYRDLLSHGVAREVARNVLPLSIYTSFYMKLNLRSLLNFLSLRWAHPYSSTPTFPLWEIQEVAKQMNVFAAQVSPVAMQLFDSYGRVAP